jgi:hypothetical protein
MTIQGWCERLFLTLIRALALCVFLGALSANISAAYAQPAGIPIAGQAGENPPQGYIDPATFRFNDHYTTPFGPAYADIWTAQQNFLACRPPVARAFSYALCYFSGPAVGTPVLAGGGPTANPPLPCALSADGNSATCTCYEIKTEQYPPFVPYFANINGILNLDLYLRTIAACGHDGELCGAQAPLRDHMWWNAAPVCRAVNTNNVIPNAELISVFSTVKNSDYVTGTTPNTTACPAGKYAGCMTAPCYHTGKTDSAGNELVECNCPVYDGPFELGQAGVPCDANELTPLAARAVSLGMTQGSSNVWPSSAPQQNSVGQLDAATARQTLISAGVDPGTIESFIATYFPPAPQQAYGDFNPQGVGEGYGNQSIAPVAADSSAAWAQLNALIDARYSSGSEGPPVYVWSAAHNPSQNREQIDPPPDGCLPDVPGQKACPLYSQMTQYPVVKGSPLCQRVCDAYRNDTRQDANGSLQVGYSCDAALCTTLGNGQNAPAPANPLAKANLLQNACGGLAEQSGLRAILALEQVDHCSCCASQVCGCANSGIDIDPVTQAKIARLNAEQQQLGITPQCQINGTLCGAEPP